jgi:aspartate/methionine/tyrosine aminotransferase
MRFCATNNIHLISDEIYALSTFSTPSPCTPFISLLSIPASEIWLPNAPNHADSDPTGLFHTEYGIAKDFGAAGLHVGALITSNTHVASAFEAISLLHAPSGASCAIAAQMLSDTDFVDSLLTLSRTRLAENYLAVTRALDEAGIGYWKGGNAGYFLWVDLSPYLAPDAEEEGSGKSKGKMGREEWDAEREKELAGRILRGGVWLNPGQERGEKPGWFRLIFSHDKKKVLEGVKR